MSLHTPKYNLSPELIDEMIRNDYKVKHRNFETHFDGTNQLSNEEIVYIKLHNIYHVLSEPLKKMHSTYLTRAAKNCYPEKHLQDDWTNLEQINLCKDITKSKIFGDFEELLHIERTKDAYKYQACLEKNRNQVIKSIECVEQYQKDIDTTNQKVATEF
mmetsp:Transcript_8781/g.9965  ORF Transcript_8781/g.9965 Transcript_8781/m.9965 type:complete len:159 (-) Transcript_8781:55-531(-)